MSEMKKINLVFLGGFDYPNGMAGTKRIQNAINGLKDYSDISIHVVVIRQSSKKNVLCGVHQGISYQTVIGDLLRAKMVLMAPFLHIKAQQIIKKLCLPNCYNVLYVYSPPSFDNMPIVNYARTIGFKIIFDIVEDVNLAKEISTSLWHRLNLYVSCRMIKHISTFTDGIVVISTHLEEEMYNLTGGSIPIKRMPISVNMDLFPDRRQQYGQPVSFFYAGSFAKKDGLPVLLEAFNCIAEKYHNTRLIMTGAGTAEAMSQVNKIIDSSPYKHRIFYKGYLDDAAYYAELAEADILCMTRIDIEYAQAGFPFKLGEYMATGKPVIASSVSDVPSLLQNRREAMLVHPGDCHSIVEAAEVLLNNQEEAFAMGARGRAMAQRLFDYRAQSKEFITFLHKVTEKA